MIEVLQVQSELAGMVALYRKRHPRRVLEIGTWEGGTLVEWLTQGKPKRVVTVDVEHRNPPEMYEEWASDLTDLRVLTGDSTAAGMKKQIRLLGPYDWAFIDGDHSYEAALSDARLALECAAPNAVLLLHDIADQEGNGPAEVFNEFGQNRYTETFVDSKHEPWGHGIGVVYL